MTTLPRIDWTLEGMLWGIDDKLGDIRWHCKTLRMMPECPITKDTVDFIAEDLMPEECDCICKLTPSQRRQIITFPSEASAVEIQLPDGSILWESNPLMLKDLLKNLKSHLSCDARSKGKIIKCIRKVANKDAYKLLLM